MKVINRTTSVTPGPDPTSIATYSFDDGSEVKEFFGDWYAAPNDAIASVEQLAAIAWYDNHECQCCGQVKEDTQLRVFSGRGRVPRRAGRSGMQRVHGRGPRSV